MADVYEHGMRELPCGGFELAFGKDNEPKGYVKAEVREGFIAVTDIATSGDDGTLFVRMLKRLCVECENRGYKEIFAHLTVGQEELKATYERAGMVQVGYVMCKELKKND